MSFSSTVKVLIMTSGLWLVGCGHCSTMAPPWAEGREGGGGYNARATSAIFQQLGEKCVYSATWSEQCRPPVTMATTQQSRVRTITAGQRREGEDRVTTTEQSNDTNPKSTNRLRNIKGNFKYFDQHFQGVTLNRRLAYENLIETWRKKK